MDELLYNACSLDDPKRVHGKREVRGRKGRTRTNHGRG